MIRVTREVAMYHTGTFHHCRLKNSDGTPLRVRTNGVCKTWKTRPDDFRLPVKYGLRTCTYITPSNAMDWTITQEDWEEVQRKITCIRLGVRFDTPDYILHDILEEQK